MATRNPKPDDTPEQPGPAAVRTQEYSAGTGWDIGQTAPEDAFRKLDSAGSGEPVGPVVHSHPGGYARQVVVKGGLITAGVKRELDAAAAEGDEG